MNRRQQPAGPFCHCDVLMCSLVESLGLDSPLHAVMGVESSMAGKAMVVPRCTHGDALCPLALRARVLVSVPLPANTHQLQCVS